MTDNDPKDYDEYLAKFMANNRLEGFGFETTMHVPCPFCCSPDFQVFAILDAEEVTQRDSQCKVCGRSAKAIVEKTDGGANTRLEIVQTGGDDPPPYLPPMRRVS